MTKFIPFSLLLIFVFLIVRLPDAQAQLTMDLSRQLQIPGIKHINSSETHLYALSESEGLVVFRAHTDSLQWLYSSTGMQERGNILESDIRFAYLYGNNRRLTVIEPTSVLGVYSSTILPARPLAAKRIGLQLFIAMGSNGLGKLSLETPESVDSDVDFINTETGAVALATDQQRTLYVLNSNNEISIYHVTEDAVQLQESIQIDRSLNRLFLIDDELIGSDRNGNIYFINSDGNTQNAGNVNAPVQKLDKWGNQLIIRTETHDLWTGELNDNLEMWKSGEQSGNYFTVTDGNLWVAEYNTLAPVIRRGLGESRPVLTGEGAEGFTLKSIPDVVLPAPRPLILPIEFASDIDLSQVSLSYSAPFDNARIRGNTLFWQPASNQTGRHSVTITATTADGQSNSTSFSIDVRPFNAPPRFSPTRPVTIPVGEQFELGISAVDPDGMDQNLIRYLGVDLPEGAEINEKTGEFTWTPSVRQVGRHNFQVIATDQYGAAASQEFTINVIEIEEEDTVDLDIF